MCDFATVCGDYCEFQAATIAGRVERVKRAEIRGRDAVTFTGDAWTVEHFQLLDVFDSDLQQLTSLFLLQTTVQSCKSNVKHTLYTHITVLLLTLHIPYTRANFCSWEGIRRVWSFDPSSGSFPRGSGAGSGVGGTRSPAAPHRQEQGFSSPTGSGPSTSWTCRRRGSPRLRVNRSLALVSFSPSNPSPGWWGEESVKNKTKSGAV